MQFISAPGAIAIDAVSFLVSAVLLRRIETPEPPVDTQPSRGVRHDVEVGLRALLGHRLLRPIVLASITDSIFLKGIAAIFVLYATRELEISPVMLGVILAVGGIGAIPGALLSAPAARRFGVGPTIIGGWLIGAATWLLIPLATGPLAVPVLAASMLLGGVAGTIVNVQQWSLRQLVTPDALQGESPPAIASSSTAPTPSGRCLVAGSAQSSVCDRRSRSARWGRSLRRYGSPFHRYGACGSSQPPHG